MKKNSIDRSISLSEAIRLAKKYGQDSSYKFITWLCIVNDYIDIFLLKRIQCVPFRRVDSYETDSKPLIGMDGVSTLLKRRVWYYRRAQLRRTGPYSRRQAAFTELRSGFSHPVTVPRALGGFSRCRTGFQPVQPFLFCYGVYVSPPPTGRKARHDGFPGLLSAAFYPWPCYPHPRREAGVQAHPKNQ